MSQTAVPSVLHLGFMIPVGPQDIEADDLTAKMRPGSYSLAVDDFGEHIFRYGRNRAGAAVSLGDFVSRAGDTNATTVLTASTGTTTRAGIVGAALTASAEVGNLLVVVNNNSSTGAAPEGEIGVIVSNTTGYINIDAARPFTTAVAASDILWVIGTWNTEYSVGLPTPDTAFTVFGCVVAQNGIASLNFGLYGVWGIVPQANYSSGGATVGQPLVIASTSAECTAQATAAIRDIIGFALAAVTAALNTGTGKAAAFMQLGFGLGPRSSVSS